MKLIKTMLFTVLAFSVPFGLYSQQTINDSVCKVTISLDSEDLLSLPDSIMKYRVLRNINLAGHKNVDWLNVSKQLSEFNRIERLSISHINLPEFPEELANLTNIEELILYNINIKLFPKSVCNMKSTQKIGLSGNNLGNLTNNELKKLFHSLAYFPELKSLDIGNNELESIPKNIIHLKKLEDLVIAYNKIQAFPQILLKMKNLKYLIIDFYPDLLASDKNYLLKMKSLKIVFLKEGPNSQFPEFTNEQFNAVCKKYPAIQFMW